MTKGRRARRGGRIPVRRCTGQAAPPPRGSCKLALVRWLAAVVALSAAACSHIPPGRSVVDSIHFVNARHVSEKEIADKIATDESPTFLLLFQGVANDYSIYDESTLQRDMARVERVYRSKGFFEAHARVARVHQVRPKHITIEIIIDEGPATLNRNVTIVGLDSRPKGVTDAARSAAVGALAPGRRFDEDAFKKAESELKRALTDRGYAFAAVASDAELDLGAHVVDYGFNIEPGPLSVFGSITFQGLDPPGTRKQEIPESPLRRAMDIRLHSLFSTAEIDSATQALLDLGVFSSVRITPSLPAPPPDPVVVPLTVQVEPLRLSEVTACGGIELDEIKTDLHVTASWEDHNFLGGLRDFRASFRPGLVLYPYRINSWTGTFRPLFEEWLKTELRQPGFIEARTDAFVRPEFNVFPMLVELNPRSTDPVLGYREVKIPLGVQRSFSRRLFVALGYTVQVESPFAYVHDQDPALQTIALSFPEVVTRLDFRDDPAKPHKGSTSPTRFKSRGESSAAQRRMCGCSRKSGHTSRLRVA